MLRQTEWWVPNGAIRRNGVFPVTTLFFWKFYFSLRTSYKELIWCTNYPNVHIHTLVTALKFHLRVLFPWQYPWVRKEYAGFYVFSNNRQLLKLSYLIACYWCKKKTCLQIFFLKYFDLNLQKVKNAWLQSLRGHNTSTCIHAASRYWNQFQIFES